MDWEVFYFVLQEEYLQKTTNLMINMLGVY